MKSTDLKRYNKYSGIAMGIDHEMRELSAIVARIQKD